MKTKLYEYLLDFVENELPAAEAASVAAEVRASAELAAEVADLQAVRAEIKSAASAATAEAVRAFDFDKLHAKIMFQIDPAFASATKLNDQLKKK